jgi:hypothetical protein
MPVINLALGFRFGNTVARLNFARENFLVALHFGQIVIGKFTPLLLNLTFKLFPVS